jgi:selenide, water dikinase
MTDVTGFGLAGHLGEMLAASGRAAELDLAQIPLYDGASALARDGIASTLLPENLALAALLRGEIDAATRAVLFDPQTSGGLLAGIPSDRAAHCVAELRSAGYRHAVIIGYAGAAALSRRDVTMTATGSLWRYPEHQNRRAD